MRSRLPRIFWLYLTGQTLSNLGTAFTAVAVPLLVFRLTRSATALGAATAVEYAPWVLFGLVGGALVDRLDRRRAMIVADLGRAAAVSVIPLLAAFGVLHVWAVYVAVASMALLSIAFSGQVAALVALVTPDQLLEANGRLSGSYSAATLAGTGLAGAVFALASVPDALWIDAASFIVSAATLAAIRVPFNADPPPGLRGLASAQLARQLLADTRAGLAYVWHRPLLRGLSVQLTLVNLFGSAATSELALYAVRALHAGNTRVGVLYASSSVGVVLLSFVVGPLGRRLRVTTVLLAALVLYGGGTTGLGLAGSYPVALVIEAAVGGATVLYNASSVTLRQRIVPNELLGRVSTIAVTFSWCAIPVGSLAGGAIIAATGDVRLVYEVVGVAIAGIGVAYNRAVLGRADESGGGGIDA